MSNTNESTTRSVTASRFPVGPGSSGRVPRGATRACGRDGAGPELRLPYYQQRIREALARNGRVGMDKPYQVEAAMRLTYSTLDGLSARDFDCEALDAARDIATWSETDREQCANSFGLHA